MSSFEDLKEMDDINFDDQKPTIHFEDLVVGDRVFDFGDEEFGTIVDIISEDNEPEWRRVEVEWEREDGVTDKSFVLPATTLGVQLHPQHPCFERISHMIGDELPALLEEYGDGLIMMALARW